MRTTVDLKPDHRKRLLAIAARRGHGGVSAVLEEAIEVYLRGEEERKRRRKRLLSAAGALREDEGEAMLRRIRQMRAKWR